MKINIKDTLNEFIQTDYPDGAAFLPYLPNVEVDTEKIKTIMINEIVPSDQADDFYSKSSSPAYLDTTFALFKEAGFPVSCIEDILSLGIYITNAVKFPKESTTIETQTIKQHVPVLEYELDLFPNTQAIMLMGDVAKKAFNMITKKRTKKNAVPSISTYKLRNNELFYQSIRLYPSYIMTGKNLLIEKSKFQMASEDIKNMMEWTI